MPFFNLQQMRLHAEKAIVIPATPTGQEMRRVRGVSEQQQSDESKSCSTTSGTKAAGAVQGTAWLQSLEQQHWPCGSVHPAFQQTFRMSSTAEIEKPGSAIAVLAAQDYRVKLNELEQESKDTQEERR